MNFPNVTVASMILSAATSAEQVEFGFDARRLVIKNRGAATVYANFGSSELATTEDVQIESSGELRLGGLPSFGLVSIFTTSTAENEVWVQGFG